MSGVAGIACVGDSILGLTSGEHSGHFPPHSASTLIGEIVSGSTNVFANGKPVARLSDSTVESDSCDSGNTGVLSLGSSTVFINGRPAARVGDEISPHNGVAHISSGSTSVLVGG